VRDYLQAQSVEFDDRNIRQSDQAHRELLALTGNSIVPVTVFGDRRVIGFDPEGLADLAQDYHAAKQGS